MMVETLLESSQDFSMSNGVLPQWKRELLQRRAARTRPAPPPTAPPPPPPPTDVEDEELRYGPGIVKRLKSRYLSLALRDAPRRRPSVLRRAASLEHLLDTPPAPRPPRVPRPASLAAPLPPTARRDAVKRARSVDALSRLDSRDEPPPSPPPPPPAPRPPPARSARPPRRMQPLLSDAERPPPDLVRSTLRKFESPCGRRAARVCAVLRGLERSSTPEPSARAPSPASADLSAIEEPQSPAPASRPVSRAALEGIARAGSTVRYSFEAPRQASHLPPLAATNPVLLGRVRASTSPRRVGVIRPMPAPTLERSIPPSPSEELLDKSPEPLQTLTPPPAEPEPRIERKESPPSAIVEPIPRSPQERFDPPTPERIEYSEPIRRTPTPDLVKPIKSELIKPELPMKPETPVKPELQLKPEPALKKESFARLESPVIKSEPIMNGHSEPERVIKVISALGSAGIERAWNGTSDKCVVQERVPRLPSPVVDKVPRVVSPVVDKVPRVVSPVVDKVPRVVSPVVDKVPRVVSPVVDKVPRVVSPVVDKVSRLSSPVVDRMARVPSPMVDRVASPAVDRVPRVVSPAAGRRAPAQGSTSVVFNFSNRKEVPDYIENDGIILRASKKDKIKVGDPGVVVLNPEALRSQSDSEDESEPDGRPASPCGVRFINDNVLINGRSSMRPDKHHPRINKLKLQFDDSLTRTFEYPSETSLCEDPPSPAPCAPAPACPPVCTPAPAACTPASQLAEPAVHAPLASNTHITSASLCRYTPHKTATEQFQLGVTRQPPVTQIHAQTGAPQPAAPAPADCADAERRWSDARATTDLLF